MSDSLHTSEIEDDIEVEQLRAENARLHDDLEAYQGQLDKKEAEIKRLTGERAIVERIRAGECWCEEAAAEIEWLRAREAQAKAIILAAAVFVRHGGGWPAIWHRDADKWVGNKQMHAGSETSC